MFNQGDTIYYFEIKIDFLKNKALTAESTNHVIASNDELFVIDDKTFTRLQYKETKYSSYDPFKVAKVSKFYLNPYFDEIRGRIYTDNKSRRIAHNAIKKALTDYMYENYGRYCKGIDLLETLKDVDNPAQPE